MYRDVRFLVDRRGLGDSVNKDASAMYEQAFPGPIHVLYNDNNSKREFGPEAFSRVVMNNVSGISTEKVR